VAIGTCDADICQSPVCVAIQKVVDLTKKLDSPERGGEEDAGGFEAEFNLFQPRIQTQYGLKEIEHGKELHFNLWRRNRQFRIRFH